MKGQAVKIKRALISVSDKQGLVEMVKVLEGYGIEIISTGGTAKVLEEAGVRIIQVSEITGFREMLDGRVKTLHPNVHGGLLADRSKEEHLKEASEMGIKMIDLVIVNLYPFLETIKTPGVKMEEAIENIDIGGPSMLRSAAKNMASVTVVIDPKDYPELIDELKANDGMISWETRYRLAKKVFYLTSIYDNAIYGYLEEEKDFPEFMNLSFQKIQDLRYGENPHQKAAYYKEVNSPTDSLVFAEKLHGRELSFNNILDLDAAWSIVNEFSVPAAVIIKHTNPCGVATAEDSLIAYQLAYECDPVSAFGSIVSFNRVVEKNLAEEIIKTYVEAIIAPSYLDEALDVLKNKEDLRIIAHSDTVHREKSLKDYRRIDGGLLVQDKDEKEDERHQMKVVTEKQPSDKEWEDLLFAWKVAKHVKSNAIVLAQNNKTIGVGAGQMSRIDASELASKKAGSEKTSGAVLASDAFFPFRDALDSVVMMGVSAVIQPGGSKRDEEVIEAANEHGIAMVFTGIRHFKH